MKRIYLSAVVVLGMVVSFSTAAAGDCADDFENCEPAIEPMVGVFDNLYNWLATTLPPLGAAVFVVGAFLWVLQSEKQQSTGSTLVWVGLFMIFFIDIVDLLIGTFNYITG